MLRLLPTFRGRKKLFFFYLTKLNSNIQHDVSIEFLKSFKALKLFRKTYVISIFCLHRALYKIHMWKLFAYGKIFARGKSKAEESPW